MKIIKSSLCINRLAQNILEELDRHPEIMLTTDREDRRGVFIFLKSSNNLMRVGNIAKALGIFKPLEDPYPDTNPRFILTDGYMTSDLKTPLSQIKRLNETGIMPRLYPISS